METAQAVQDPADTHTVDLFPPLPPPRPGVDPARELRSLVEGVPNEVINCVASLRESVQWALNCGMTADGVSAIVDGELVARK